MSEEWEKVYAGYVIFDRQSRFYLVTDVPDVCGAAVRREGTRFTKEEALLLIKNERFRKSDFVIEDAK
jgi:hypothetical protein